LPSTPEKLFDFHDDIRSAMVVDRIGNVLSFASRTGNPVDPAFVKDITAKWTAMLGGMLRGTEASWGVLKWVHLRFNKLHVYGWVIDEGYLVFTTRNQLEDPLLDAIATSRAARSLYADKWSSNGKEG
jgi:hypothetical protein